MFVIIVFVCIYLRNKYILNQTLVLDSAVVEAQKMLSSQGGFLTIAIYHRSESI